MMEFTDCEECKKNTFVSTEDLIGCVNKECNNVEWQLVAYYLEDLNNEICNKLGFCGCGDPETCIVFIKDFLNLKHLRSEDLISWDEYENQRIKLFNDNADALMWIIEYLLDDKRITTHGGNVSGSWIDDMDFLVLINRFVDEHKKNNSEKLED